MVAGLRLSPEQYAAIQKRRGALDQVAVKAGKYHNKKVVVDGIEFDSKREATRYQDLARMQQAGQISELRRQVQFSLDVNGEHVCNYVADFVFRRDHRLVVADAKGVRTKDYILKRKLMHAVHGVVIEEM